ncbi:hypothetical protein [Acidisoma silvae]|uniref:DUF1080 domain-containing protein n=1 Tax=Acidisoma silvae TaxID=2802396 RepID=A0A963YUA8_9PROT|nr:hypothetical protein [Acidisoma silvae]MCB8876413.1 hypothetical protein [Acidisoma silvae]
MSLPRLMTFQFAVLALLALGKISPALAAPQVVLSDPLSSWPLNFGAQGGSLLLKNGFVHIVLAPNTANWAIYNGFTFTNMDASVTVASQTKAGTLGGLIFWASGPSDFFVFYAADLTGTFAVYRRVSSGNPGWRNIVPFMKSPAIKMGEANTLRVVTKGNSVSLFINGQAVGTLGIMAPDGGGAVGIEAESDAKLPGEFAFSNLTVSQ